MKSKLPKNIQEIIDNQGKTVKKVDEEMKQAIIDMEREDKKADKQLRKALGC